MGLYGHVDIGERCIAIIPDGDEVRLVVGRLIEERHTTRIAADGRTERVEYCVDDGRESRWVMEIVSADDTYSYQLTSALQRALTPHLDALTDALPEPADVVA